MMIYGHSEPHDKGASRRQEAVNPCHENHERRLTIIREAAPKIRPDPMGRVFLRKDSPSGRRVWLDRT
jgi:hypothetical protein